MDLHLVRAGEPSDPGRRVSSLAQFASIALVVVLVACACAAPPPSPSESPTLAASLALPAALTGVPSDPGDAARFLAQATHVSQTAEAAVLEILTRSGIPVRAALNGGLLNPDPPKVGPLSLRG